MGVWVGEYEKAAGVMATWAAVRAGQPALLVTAPRGAKRTTFLRAAAAQVMRAAAEPGSQETHEEIMRGRCVDVVEVDAEIGNGVAHVRDLVEAVKYAPVSAPFKVFIVDEAHLLSAGAMAAVLKLLENPPDHVKLVLATAKPGKLPFAIADRCQRVTVLHEVEDEGGGRVGARDAFDGLEGVAEKGGAVSVWTAAGRFDGALDNVGSDVVELKIGTRWVRLMRASVLAVAWESGESPAV